MTDSIRYCLDARTASDHFPGIGRYVSNLARRMVDLIEPHETLILLTTPEGQVQASKTLSASWQLPGPRVVVDQAGFPGRVVQVEAAASPFGLTQQWQIPRVLSRMKVDVYHSPYYLMPYRPGRPTLFTLYDLIPDLFPEYVSERARLFFGLATRLALRTADRVITISEASKRDLLARYPVQSKQVQAIPLAADPKLKPQSDAVQDRIRQKYELPPVFVLYFGINKPHKNLVRLMAAWQQVLKLINNPRISLVIAGAWDERYPEAKAESILRDLHHSVRFLGPIPSEDQAGLMSAATAFVFPSLYEGFGLPVIEAMACGTPVVCANTSSLPEVAGEAALLFDPNSMEDIAQALLKILANLDLQSELRTKGLAQADRFSWARTAAETLDAYRTTVR
jgi:alpha-1,3-rhamnosyl/mannosyltransferase